MSKFQHIFGGGWVNILTSLFEKSYSLYRKGHYKIQSWYQESRFAGAAAKEFTACKRELPSEVNFLDLDGDGEISESESALLEPRIFVRNPKSVSQNLTSGTRILPYSKDEREKSSDVLFHDFPSALRAFKKL